jgi:hypothetical protein
VPSSFGSREGGGGITAAASSHQAGGASARTVAGIKRQATMRREKANEAKKARWAAKLQWMDWKPISRQRSSKSCSSSTGSNSHAARRPWD